MNYVCVRCFNVSRCNGNVKLMQMHESITAALHNSGLDDGGDISNKSKGKTQGIKSIADPTTVIPILLYFS